MAWTRLTLPTTLPFNGTRPQKVMSFKQEDPRYNSDSSYYPNHFLCYQNKRKQEDRRYRSARSYYPNRFLCYQNNHAIDEFYWNYFDINKHGSSISVWSCNDFNDVLSSISGLTIHRSCYHENSSSGRT